MEYVGGASAKFYAVSLEEEDGETWRVRFNFGRIGFPRAWDTRVEGAAWARAITAYMALVDEKMGKGYEPRPWPANLTLPDGGQIADDHATEGLGSSETLFRADRKGVLPPEVGASIAGIPIPAGRRWSATPEGGNRGDGPVIWGSLEPVRDVGRIWAKLAAAFPETGLWPLVIDAKYGFRGFDDYLMDACSMSDEYQVALDSWAERESKNLDDEATLAAFKGTQTARDIRDQWLTTEPGERAVRVWHAAVQVLYRK
jgi:predicted DNA-binding WGR domain protein